MSCRSLILFLGLALSRADLVDDVKAEIRKEIGDYMTKYTTRGLWYGWSDGTYKFSDAMGYDDLELNTTAKVGYRVPGGSIMKTFTGAAVMALSDQGKVDISKSIMEYAGPWYEKASGGTTLDSLYGPGIYDVTVQMCLHMSSGIQDYDDANVYVWTMMNPTKDLDPLMYLKYDFFTNKTFQFPPGQMEAYSSINYELLGMVVAQVSGVANWEEVDFLFPYTQSVKQQLENVLFLGKGPCRNYERMVHAYGLNYLNGTLPKRGPLDLKWYNSMWDISCLNGFGLGNVAVSAQDAAHFAYLLLGTEDIIKNSTKQDMRDWKVMDTGWGKGIVTYGLALMQMNNAWYSSVGSLKRYDAFTKWEGHGGQDFGSGGMMYFIPGLNAGMAILTNKDWTGSTIDNAMWNHIQCIVYSVLMKKMGQGVNGMPPVTVNCGPSEAVFDDLDVKQPKGKKQKKRMELYDTLKQSSRLAKGKKCLCPKKVAKAFEAYKKSPWHRVARE